MSDKPMPCPNPECDSTADLWVQDDGPAGHQARFCVQCCCGYSSPGAPTESEAIRLHNALCAASGIPTEELEKLASSWKKEARDSVPSAYADRNMHYKYLKGDNYGAGQDDCADELRSLISRVTEGKKDE